MNARMKITMVLDIISELIQLSLYRSSVHGILVPHVLTRLQLRVETIRYVAELRQDIVHLCACVEGS